MTTANGAYERLGLRIFINARGTITTLGGSVMPRRVAEAMVEASRNFVHLNELQQRASGGSGKQNPLPVPVAPSPPEKASPKTLSGLGESTSR